jgi:hypothetical protein
MQTSFACGRGGRDKDREGQGVARYRDHRGVGVSQPRFALPLGSGAARSGVLDTVPLWGRGKEGVFLAVAAHRAARKMLENSNSRYSI